MTDEYFICRMTKEELSKLSIAPDPKENEILKEMFEKTNEISCYSRVTFTKEDTSTYTQEQVQQELQKFLMEQELVFGTTASQVYVEVFIEKYLNKENT